MFKRPAGGITMIRADRRGDLSRKSSEWFRELRSRYDRLACKLILRGVVWPPPVIYHYAFRASRLTREQLVLTLATLEVS